MKTNRRKKILSLVCRAIFLTFLIIAIIVFQSEFGTATEADEDSAPPARQETVLPVFTQPITMFKYENKQQNWSCPCEGEYPPWMSTAISNCYTSRNGPTAHTHCSYPIDHVDTKKIRPNHPSCSANVSYSAQSLIGGNKTYADQAIPDIIPVAEFGPIGKKKLLCRWAGAGGRYDLWIVNEDRKSESGWSIPYFTGVGMEMAMGKTLIGRVAPGDDPEEMIHVGGVTVSDRKKTLALTIGFCAINGKKQKTDPVYKRNGKLYGRKMHIDLRNLEQDSDGDGLTDRLETRLGTDSSKKDTDGDGLDDASDSAPRSSFSAETPDSTIYQAVFTKIVFLLLNNRDRFNVALAHTVDGAPVPVYAPYITVLNEMPRAASYDVFPAYHEIVFGKPEIRPDGTIAIATDIYSPGFVKCSPVFRFSRAVNGKLESLGNDLDSCR